MILSAQSIRKLCLENGMLDPFSEELRDENNISYGLGSCSYSIRLAQDIDLFSNSFMLASTIEYFRMPKNICAVVRDKSTWARRGIAVQNTHIDPGWCGYLTLEVSKHSQDYGVTVIPAGTGIAQIVFEMLDEETELPYNGKYQFQKQGPQKAL
jgi:dCTP deaminase